MKKSFTFLALIMLLSGCSTSQKTYYEIPKSEVVEPKHTQAETAKPSATPSKTAEPVASAKDENYLFPSDSKLITDSDLYGKSKDDVALIRNEIYAKHGYIFQTEPFKSYFGAKDWYVPNEYFDDSLFNEIEKANKDFIVQYEQKMGWR